MCLSVWFLSVCLSVSRSFSVLISSPLSLSRSLTQLSILKKEINVLFLLRSLVLELSCLLEGSSTRESGTFYLIHHLVLFSYTSARRKMEKRREKIRMEESRRERNRTEHIRREQNRREEI